MDIGDETYWDLLIKRSIARFFMLACLSQKPMHGYELRRWMKDAYPNCCEPSDAMIYPALRQLQEGDYVSCRRETKNGREQNICSLTEKGVAAFAVAAQAWAKAVPYILEAINLEKEEAMERTPEEIKAHVRERYGSVARQAAEASC